MRGQAGADHRTDIPPAPLHDLEHARPEALASEIGIGGIGSGDDERVQPLLLEGFEVPVVGGHVRASPRTAFLASHAEGVNIYLGDAVAAADEAQELALGRLQGRIRHHVQQPDVQLADVLAGRPFRAEDIEPLRLQACECGETGMGDQGHGQRRRASPSAETTSSRKSASSRTLSAAFGVYRVSVIVRDREVQGPPVLDQTREDPLHEVVRNDGIAGIERLLVPIGGQTPVQEFFRVVERLGLGALAPEQVLLPIRADLEIEDQRIGGENGEGVGAAELAHAAARVIDEMRIAVDVVRLLDEMHDVAHRVHFGLAMQALAALELV